MCVQNNTTAALKVGRSGHCHPKDEQRTWRGRRCSDPADAQLPVRRYRERVDADTTPVRVRAGDDGTALTRGCYLR